MISESYIKDLLLSMGYIKKNHIYEKFFPSVDCYIKVDLKNRTIIYPEDRGMTISNRTTCNFSAPENFVVLECVTRLFDKGYRPKHLNLEKEWTLGHESKGGRADICVSDQEGNTLFIVECKTYGREYEKEYKNIVNDGGQLFSYWQQERSCKFLVLYASKYEGKPKLCQRPDILLKLLKFQSFELPLHICFIHSWRFRQNINIKNHSDSDAASHKMLGKMAHRMQVMIFQTHFIYILFPFCMNCPLPNISKIVVCIGQSEQNISVHFNRHAVFFIFVIYSPSKSNVSIDPNIPSFVV